MSHTHWGLYLNWLLCYFCVSDQLAEMSFYSIQDLKICFVFPRPTSPTGSRWSCTGTTSSRSRTAGSCRWRGRTCWRPGCGSSLSRRRAWTMAAWPGSGSSSCPRRCSTPTTACSSTPPRKSAETSEWRNCAPGMVGEPWKNPHPFVSLLFFLSLFCFSTKCSRGAERPYCFPLRLVKVSFYFD